MLSVRNPTHSPASGLFFLTLAALVSSHATAAPSGVGAFEPAAMLEKYCFECHSGTKPEGDIHLERLVAERSIGRDAEDWAKVVEMIETSDMPPSDASLFPTAGERAAAANWIQATLTAYEKEHAGEPGYVTVRRLTSGEYAYAIRDLTGIDIKVGVDASSDSVGGEGFTNFGDVQFVQDASIERYLEAAKQVAEHAVIGAGPLEFFPDPGKTGLELSALYRLRELYATKGFRVVSGEGGRPFGLERYGKAFFAAWYYRHRAALGEPRVTLRELAAREGVTGRFADHLWSVIERTDLGYPSREMIDRWKALPAPAGDAPAAIANARAGCDALSKYLTTWPSWFFARGDLAAGGAGDESPLVFNDTSLKAEGSHAYTYNVGNAGGLGRNALRSVGPTPVVLRFAAVNPIPGVKPVVIWRNPRIITRARPELPPEAKGLAPDALPALLRRLPPGPVLATRPLREVLPAEVSARLAFGTSPDGSAMGPEDFATAETVSFQIDVPEGKITELVVSAELGRDRNAVVRVILSDKAEGPSRNPILRAILADAESEGYRIFRAGMAEYAALLPPNSHGEPNPADKDPVPLPFDSTYNTPEHDAFVLKVKYQRNDRFFTENLVDGAERDRLNQAWDDLLGSWPYHDAYLGMLAEHYGVTLKSSRIAELDDAQFAALPAEMQSHVQPLRVEYRAVMEAHASAEPGQVEDALAFASRAWRRPLTTDEAERLRGFYRRSRAEDALDHDGAIRALLARILVSPAFLYRLETVAEDGERALTDWELASRLSFFLWSSIPDDELRRAAAAGELTQPAMLEQQVKRMTADPKARRLATEFFGQWLGFYHFSDYRGVDTGRFPEFTDEVKGAMYDEAVSTFEYIVRHERPIKEVLQADYTFLNEPLAKFYGLETGVTSKAAMVKVEGARAFNRGGALRLGAVLTTTSAPLRTSPVKRGDWILRRILGTPTPPPPAEAGTLAADPKTFGGLTLRQKLDEHKRNASCANCHVRIDPLGFPLEGFDAVGRTRQTYEDGGAVDVTGELGDKRTIAGAEGLLDYLKGKDEQVMRTLAKKMLGYALGRTVLASDRPLIDELVAAGSDAAFSDLAARIVNSRQFRHRQDRQEESLDNEMKRTTQLASESRASQ